MHDDQGWPASQQEGVGQLSLCATAARTVIGVRRNLLPRLGGLQIGWLPSPRERAAWMDTCGTG